MSEYWALNDEGRLYIPNLTPESIPYDIYDRSASSWYLDSETNRIDVDIIPDAISCSPPFPIGVWYVQSNRKLHAGGIPDKIYGQSPYPQGVWYMKSGGQLHAGGIPSPIGWQLPYLPYVWHINEAESCVTQDNFLEPPSLGAFAHAENLAETKTSRNLESIGEYSFQHTALTEVILPPGCTYYDTSFPEYCVIIQ